jgi:hypothetical protein
VSHVTGCHQGHSRTIDPARTAYALGKTTTAAATAEYFAGSLGVDEACEAILAGFLGRNFLVIPGRRANFA